MTQATAPGKIILFGEHAVVYGRPAIAAPITQVRAKAHVVAGTTDEVRLVAPDLDIDKPFSQADDDALAATVRLVQQHVGLAALPPLNIVVTSDIPIASGLGSGAALTAALIRALAKQLRLVLTREAVSDLTYEIEKIHHGTPSGIDNTVVAYEQPVYFIRQQPHNHIEPFAVAHPLHLLIADTGVRSSTKVAVGDVRQHWLADTPRFEALFDECGRITQTARHAIEKGDQHTIGQLMYKNHALLQEMTVSSPELDNLVEAANEAGALGAKLSGAGRGGNMIALVSEAEETAVYEALLQAGAVRVLRSTV